MLAWKLVVDGHSVTLIDRDPPESGGAAAWTAAGMLTPYAEADDAEP
ncbi:MAG: FAD-dependent oxidoreductase, partial [Gammaproteobacteria bacterium]|nr:FAD-dependent oxidoreductase [Gammaproteobacteria bacterium]